MKTTPRKRTKPAPKNGTPGSPGSPEASGGIPEGLNLHDELAITKIAARGEGGGTWVTGTIYGHRFEALVFDEHAENPTWEIGRTEISKLWLQRQVDKAVVYSWDRGIDVRAANPIAATIVEFLCYTLRNRIDVTTATMKPARAGEPALVQIAKEQLGLDTLQTRNSDRLDFHELAVWQIAKALDAAYRAGQTDAKKRPQRK